MSETAKQAARKLAAPMLDKGFKAIALHTYTDEQGVPLYWRIRLKHPDGEKWIRPMKQEGDSFIMGEPKFEDGKPLYELHRLAANPNASIWLVEGEAKVDALNKLGLIATTSGGATSAGAANWEPLQGRDVHIWPDNDEAGQRYADEVENILIGMGCTVSRVDVDKLGLGEAEDVVDWFVAHPLATRDDIEALPRLTYTASPENASTGLVSSAYFEAMTTCAADIVPEPISWLWNGWLAAGKLHTLAGAPGTGKTTLSLSLAATLTTAGRWPDGTPCPQSGNVLIWSGEDDPADTLVPRLDASGANLNRVHFLTGTRDTQSGEVLAFDPSRDIPAIEALAQRIGGVSMLIIDPIVSATGGADSHKNAEVRRALQPVVDIGRLLGCCIIGISHFSKGTQGRDPTERVTGSLAFGALARVVLAAAKLPEDDGGGRLLCRTKSNIGADHGGVKYDLLEKETSGGIFASYAAWGECVEGAARELLAQADTQDDSGEKSDADEAADLLSEILAGGACLVKQATRQLRDSGFTDKQIRRAREKLGVKRGRTGFGKTATDTWSLPHSCHDSPFLPIPAQANCVGMNGKNGAGMESVGSNDDIIEVEL